MTLKYGFKTSFFRNYLTNGEVNEYARFTSEINP